MRIDNCQSVCVVVNNPFLAHRGHWYTCPNGHIFGISECGGAMQVSKCTECGEAIGGGDHNLLQSNQYAYMVEDIAAQQGQATSLSSRARSV